MKKVKATKIRWHCMCTDKKLPEDFELSPGPWTTMGVIGTKQECGIKCLKCYFWKWRKR